MKNISIFEKAGPFAENKDIARTIRIEEIMPALEIGGDIVIDFDHVGAATQSFIHALISDVLRRFGSGVLDRIVFKSCNDTVRKIVAIVVDYMQEGQGIRAD